MTRRRRAAVLAALLLVGACTAPPLAPSDPTPLVPAAVANDINPLPRDAVADAGTLRFAIAEIPAQWNPRHPDGQGADAVALRGPLSPGHLELDAAGRATANPDFLAGLQVTHDDVTRVVLDLNPRAVWGDGTGVTADDWIATWRAASGQVPGVTAVGGDGWDSVADVAAGEDTLQVVLTYAGVEPDWAQPLVAGPSPAASVSDAAAFDGWTSYRAADFAGPFVVDHVDRTQGVVTLARNPLWWGDAPKLDAITFRLLPPEAVGAAFQHNELDWFEIGTSLDRAEQSRVATDTTVRTAPGTAGRMFALSTTGPLADAALRRALLQGLDRAAIARADLEGITEEPQLWNNSLLLTSQPGYVDQARATGLDFDAQAAGTTLDDAGWPLVDGLRAREGAVLTLSFAAAEGDELASREYEEVADQLAALGIDLRRVDTGADITPTTAWVDAFPLAELPASATAMSAEAAARVASETDPVRRADQASQLTRVLWQEATTIPLYQLPQNVSVRGGLANAGAPAYASVAWEDVGWSR